MGSFVSDLKPGTINNEPSKHYSVKDQVFIKCFLNNSCLHVYISILEIHCFRNIFMVVVCIKVLMFLSNIVLDYTDPKFY